MMDKLVDNNWEPGLNEMVTKLAKRGGKRQQHMRLLT